MKNKKIDKKHLTIGICYIALGFILIGISVYKYLKTNDISSSNIEITLLLLLSVIYFFYNNLKNKVSLPVNIKGKILNIEATKEAKKKRIKSYLIKSIFFAIIITSLYLILYLFSKGFKNLIIFNTTNTLNLIYNLIIIILLSFIMSFGLETLFGETSIKNYNKFKKE